MNIALKIILAYTGLTVATTVVGIGTTCVIEKMTKPILERTYNCVFDHARKQQDKIKEKEESQIYNIVDYQ